MKDVATDKICFKQCCGSGMFMPDPNFFHPGSGVKEIPGSASKNLSILSQKIVSKLSELWSGMFIPDPDLDVFTHLYDHGKKI